MLVFSTFFERERNQWKPDTVRKEVSSDEASDTLRGVIWLEPRRRKA